MSFDLSDTDIELQNLLKKLSKEEKKYYAAKISGGPVLTDEVEIDLKNPNSSSLKDLLNAVVRVIGNQNFVKEMLNQAKKLRNMVNYPYDPKLTKRILTEDEEKNKNAISAFANRLERNAREQSSLNKNFNDAYRAQRTNAYLDSLSPALADGITDTHIAYLNEASTPMELIENLETRRPDLAETARHDEVAKRQIMHSADIGFEIRTLAVETAVHNHISDPRHIDSITSTPFRPTLRPVLRAQRPYKDLDNIDSEKYQEFKNNLRRAIALEKGITQIIEGSATEPEKARAILQLVSKIVGTSLEEPGTAPSLFRTSYSA